MKKTSKQKILVWAMAIFFVAWMSLEIISWLIPGVPDGLIFLVGSMSIIFFMGLVFTL